MATAEDKTLLASGVQALQRLNIRLKKGKTLKAGERAALALLTGAEEQGEGHRVFDSIAACSAATKTPKSTLQKLKKEGCPAFKGSRVYESLLMPWLRAREEVAASLGEPEDKTVLECRLLRLKCEREQDRRDRDRKLFISWAEVDEFITSMAVSIKRILSDRFRKEFPHKLAGLNAERIAEKLLEMETDIVKQVQWAGAAGDGDDDEEDLDGE